MAVVSSVTLHVDDFDNVEAKSYTDPDSGHRTTWVALVARGLGDTSVRLHLSANAADALMAALIDLARIRDTHALAAEAAS